MRINSIQNLNNIYKISNSALKFKPSFAGTKNLKNKGLYVFDLDGTLAAANSLQMNSIRQKAKNSILKYFNAAQKAINEWREDNHKRDEKGRFTKSGNQKYNKERFIEREEIKLPSKEYGKIVHNLNNNLSEEERKKVIITKYIDGFKYFAINKGFNEYIIIRKEPIDNDYN